jgi:hypothetical protein
MVKDRWGVVLEAHETLLLHSNSLQNPFDHIPIQSRYVEITASVKPMVSQPFEDDRILVG